MRIRTLLGYSILAAIAMMGGLIVAEIVINTELEAVSQTQGRAQSAAREVAKLLVLTHEYALYSEKRAAQQWRKHQAEMAHTLEEGTQDAIPVAEDAVVKVRGLSATFQQLVEAGSADDGMRSQRASLLLGQLLTNTQFVNDAVQRWAREAQVQRRRMEQRFHVLAVGIPMAMLLTLAAMATLIYRRVLRPLSTLHAAMRSVADGRNLTVSSTTSADDEFGELSRTFDAMAVDLVNELRQEVQERIGAQEKEHEARQAAEAANRAKSAFLTAMSHELRTPLNAILGYEQVIARDGRLTERQERALATIRQSGQHLLTLINDLLDLGKIDAGKFGLVPAAMNPEAFLQAVADIVRIEAEEKDLLCSCTVPAGLPAGVLADEKRLRQVLLNLLSNAVKFTDHGRVDLGVEILAQDAATVHLRFEVADTGIGLSADRIEPIFQPFEQAGEARHRSGGTGLGLTISRHLVRLMGADIHVESQLGRGSRFWFDLALPLADASAFAVPPATAVREDLAATPPAASPPSHPDPGQREQAMVIPAAADMDVLHQFALAGDMRAIRQHAERLAALDARHAPFAEVLLSMARSYQSKAILDLVERHLPRQRAS